MNVRVPKKTSQGARKKERPVRRDDTPVQETDTQRAEPVSDAPSKPPFSVVGIGASAGGLEAFTALLKALPADTGMAFVLVQHMDPAHASSLSKVLSRATAMPVKEVTRDTGVEPNQVYVMPSSADITIHAGVLHLVDRHDAGGTHLPIDHFFTSLAEDRNSAAIGVILSGTASDGTHGLQAIKQEGGITFAQDEASARHRGMPGSAVASGCVDFVLPPEQIAATLIRISRQPGLAVSPSAVVSDQDTFRQVCQFLHSVTGVDFLQYKPATISRRIGRRMALQKIDKLQDYLQYLRKNSAEVGALYQDIFIHVTGFFRDPHAFRALRARILPDVIGHRTTNQSIRVWVPGCSTGEEAYSIAILLVEALGERALETRIQVFGTDISESTIQHARTGIYAEASLANVSRPRLRKFFLKVEGGYQVFKSIRELCVFARHDLTSDPPFSKLDLISCRNVLIYMGSALQKRMVDTFHYALKPGGYLFLGKSESLGAHGDLFALEDRMHKVYSRKMATTPHFEMTARRSNSESRAVQEEAPSSLTFDLKKEVDRILLERFAPPALVVDPDLRVLYFQGDTSLYLAPAAGEPSFHMLRLLRPELVVEVRAAIQKVKKTRAPEEFRGIRLKHDGQSKLIRVEVRQLPGRRNKGCDFLVIFHEETPRQTSPDTSPTPDVLPAVQSKGQGKEVLRLSRELASTREYLRTLVEDHEATYEELKAANEEVLSANEELQSTNEELETTKEELQSSNEELTTLNEELQNRNGELVQLADDLNNLLIGVNIPIAILDHELRIRRFTPEAEKTLGLIPADLGRPFRHIAPTLMVSNWDQLFAEALERLRIVEREVQDNQGHWYTLHVRPYTTSDQRITGVLLALLDIDTVKRSLDAARQARDYAEAIVETIQEPLLVLDSRLRILSANNSFYHTFQTTAEETVNRVIFEVGDRQWDIPRLRELLQHLLPHNTRIEDFEVENNFPNIGLRHMLLNARRLDSGPLDIAMILLAIKDVTGQVSVTKELQASEARYRAIVQDQTDLICRFLPDGTITFVNQAYCRYFGRSFEDLLGRNFLEELVADADREATRKHLAAITLQSPVRTFTRRMALTGDRWRQWVTRALFDERGQIVEFQSAGRDVTDLKQNESSLLRYQEELRALTAKLISAQEETSKHLARELHDAFSQKLAVLGMELAALQQSVPVPSASFREQLRQIASQISGLAKDIHQFSRQLHPAILDDLGLVAALNHECIAFTEQYGVRAVFTAQNVEDPPPEEVSLCLYRVAQESFRNIGKHAGASEVRSSLVQDGDEIIMIVEDFGDGFDMKDIKHKGGLGLVSMDERVRLVDGVLSIQSAPGRGTRVVVRVPLKRSQG